MHLDISIYKSEMERVSRARKLKAHPKKRLGRHIGLARCRAYGEVGLERDVGWGVFACAISLRLRPSVKSLLESRRHEAPNKQEANGAL